MSNVLIGIIGVILFIGLALAGALFLGPRFQESTNTSKAAGNVQAAQQISNAIDLYRIQEGRPFDPSTFPSGLEGSYLKTLPTMQGTDPGTVPNIGTVVVGGENVAIVRSRLSPESGKAICEATQKQITGSIVVPTEAKDRIGCYTANSRYFFYGRVDAL